MPRSRTNKHLAAARRALVALVLLVVGIAGWQWLQSYPQHSPWAPLDLRDPPGWATRTKLIALRSDVTECRAVLERSDVAFTALPATGEGACVRPDRTRLGDYPLAPDTPAVTCPVAAALELWRRESVAPAARNILGSDLARIEHLGAFSCRRMYGGTDGPWSEHATANAIDIAAFVLEDGRRISVLGDWDGEADKAAFLRAVRDGACGSFATVLSPDYNAAHADHFHLDQDDRWAGVCR
ncbi:extensin family protein [uncultured Erythrobacter sp.]|uniref:extensin-like domain-containing protein n=1 Tax=uncultured Erythrobacter sp. TaxID=263913 RepID=UPI00265B4FFB|nr:extensin family protein [uncultured Erythrobacter sp.]